MVGPMAFQVFDPKNQRSLESCMSYRAAMVGQHPGDERALYEAVGVGVDVSSFADINAWTAVSSGLIERKILEQFDNPIFIGSELMPDEYTKIAEGQKIIGAARIGNLAEERQPGETHKRAGFGERYVTLGKTRELGLALDLNKEAVFFDLTGQVLQTASKVGEWIAFQDEYNKLDAFIGVTTQSGGKWQFVYKGTGTNTYQITNANGFGYTNQVSNQLVDWTNLQASWLLFARMLDPETGTRIGVMPDTIVVNPAQLATARLIIDSPDVERRSAGLTGTQANASVLQISHGGKNPAGDFGVKRLLWSPLLEERCTDALGLNLTQPQANAYWWHLQAGKAFKNMVNWPLNIAQAPPNSYDMLDRGIIASYFANLRSMPSVWSPWHVVLNTI